MCYKYVESVFRHMYSIYSTLSQKEGFSHSIGLEYHFVQNKDVSKGRTNA